ncbi:MAG: BrnT family toxin, partial [Alphaproteobacteria bacterium]|nr:BrnT family toxin [Alphaproteobacteria bacterium]
LDDRIVHIVFTDRGDLRRIISARLAHWNERVIYENGTYH